MSCLDNLDGLLAQSIAKNNVPGASLAVWHKDKLYTAASGVLNTDTGVEATIDSAFQIGSITKLFTATLIMQLVEDGRLELDVPIVDYLPEFGLADMQAARKITLWHLLTHTSGMVGDVFIETGRGEDRHQRFVDMCRFLPMLHPVGEYHSYCNTGWTVAGRIAEVVTNRTWDHLMGEKIFKPLGMKQAFTLPEDAPRYRTALGHNFKDGKFVPITTPYLCLSGAPAGATPSMSASDLIKFGRMALGGGALDGETILSADTLANMQSHQFTADKRTSWGLGWIRYNWSGIDLLGHDGGTMGQNAYFRIVPQQNLAVVLLANRSPSLDCFKDLFTTILSELANTQPPATAVPDPALSLNLELYEGHYDACLNAMDVFVKDGQLRLKMREIEGGDPGFQASEPAKLKPVSADLFVMEDKGGGPPMEISFIDFSSQGRPDYLRIGSRLARRT